MSFQLVHLIVWSVGWLTCPDIDWFAGLHFFPYLAIQTFFYIAFLGTAGGYEIRTDRNTGRESSIRKRGTRPTTATPCHSASASCQNWSECWFRGNKGKTGECDRIKGRCIFQNLFVFKLFIYVCSCTSRKDMEWLTKIHLFWHAY